MEALGVGCKVGMAALLIPTGGGSKTEFSAYLGLEASALTHTIRFPLPLSLFSLFSPSMDRLCRRSPSQRDGW